LQLKNPDQKSHKAKREEDDGMADPSPGSRLRFAPRRRVRTRWAATTKKRRTWTTYWSAVAA
jgi:hypothetical protein